MNSKCLFFLVFSLCLSCTISAQKKKKNENADPLKIKVAVVYENPVYPQHGNKRLHECFFTPNLKGRIWYDPVQLSAEYEKTLEEVSGYTVDYEVVKEIDADRFFTYFKNDPFKRPFTKDEVAFLMGEEDWKTLKDIGTSYDYNAMVKYYGFDKMRDNGEIHEVWVWTFPYGGMWESHMMGKGAFWINSQPNENPSCTELLSIMGLNYERDLACAMESYGHRYESTMMQVFGWWAYDKKSEKSELTMWERYTGYVKNYDKFDKGNSNIGNIHFPPNGEKDYDWSNKTPVYSYADEWVNYPDIKEKKGRIMDCSEWNCSHIGYMKWWFSHTPHFKGLDPVNGKLNNWWHYVVDYNNAVKEEARLKEELNKKKKK
ncbi:hypothetical protein [Prevotella sp. 10(H)]|uniref:hypothetical protein n=1 Tax=Prevotella sp. 10(H) TaxID=1158294 RepID=UPI000A5DB7C2|nr:hypothetical protein [Prevotella sp. 10(H)]